jgi:Flp pilus assembly protein TadG
MGKNLTVGNISFSRLRSIWSRRPSSFNKGQALVEFTLCFLMILVIAWIPADFGLAFYTSQLLGNAAREGARIGAATPGSGTVVVSGVTLPALNSADFTDIATETCRRLPSALLTDPANGWTSCSPFSNARVSVDTVAGTGTCNQMVRVQVAGNYNYFFYQLLRLIRASADNSTVMTRQTSMRWEHQAC